MFATINDLIIQVMNKLLCISVINYIFVIQLVCCNIPTLFESNLMQ